LVPSRDGDTIGAGVFHVEFSDEAEFANDGETAVEVFYRAQVTGWFSVKPDFQYIFNPGGTTNDDSVVVGARAELIF
jgi:carbohydrate-selective porin OprB